MIRIFVCYFLFRFLQIYIYVDREKLLPTIHVDIKIVYLTSEHVSSFLLSLSRLATVHRWISFPCLFSLSLSLLL